MKLFIVAIIAISFLLTAVVVDVFGTEFPIGRVVESYRQNAATYMMIETHQMLKTSQTIYLHGGTPAIVREIVSVKEKEGIYYYRAYIQDAQRIVPGEYIYQAPISQSGRLKEFEEEVMFKKKKNAQVILVRGNKAAINKGSLHDVDKRDTYKVLDRDGRTKGIVETYGVGDFLSLGHIESFNAFGSKFDNIELGDQAIFVGNRKIIGTGFLYLLNSKNISGVAEGSGAVETAGGASLWSIILRRGWAIEINLGGSSRESYPPSVRSTASLYRLPLWARKSFFYPGLVSPFMGIGMVMYELRIEPSSGSGLSEKRKNGVSPFGSVGLEFFTGRMIHLRLDYHYYPTPSLEFNGRRHKFDGRFPFGGVTINW